MVVSDAGEALPGAEGLVDDVGSCGVEDCCSSSEESSSQETVSSDCAAPVGW